MPRVVLLYEDLARYKWWSLRTGQPANKVCLGWTRGGSWWGVFAEKWEKMGRRQKSIYRWVINTVYDGSSGYRTGGKTSKRKKKWQNQIWEKTRKQGRHATHQALKCYFSPFIIESFSVHLIIQWLNYNTLIALTVRPCGKIIKFPWFWSIQLHHTKCGKKGKKKPTSEQL